MHFIGHKACTTGFDRDPRDILSMAIPMNRLHWYAIALPFVFAAATPRPGVAQGRRPITETDLFKFVWAADPQISPNGSQVAFVLVNVNEDKDRYETQIYIIPMDGGEARALTDAPKGASSPVWSPDGRIIAFVSTPDSSSAQAKTDSAKKIGDSTQKKHVSDVRVITRAQYRWNGGGYTDPTAHSHLWTVPASFTSAGGLPIVKQLTFGEFDEGEPVWASDGSRLYFTSNRRLEPYYESRGDELYSVCLLYTSDAADE